MNKRIKMPSPALLVAMLALFASVGGGTAAALSGKNKVSSNDIQRDAVKSSDINNGAVKDQDVKDNDLTGQDIKNDSLTGDDINEATLIVARVRARQSSSAKVAAPPGGVAYDLGGAAAVAQQAGETLQVFGTVRVEFPANCTGARSAQVLIEDQDGDIVGSAFLVDPAGTGPSVRQAAFAMVPFDAPETAETRNLTANALGTCAGGGGDPVVGPVDLTLFSIRG